MMPLPAQRHQHQERAQVHERVDHDIDRDTFDPGRISGDQAEQHVSGVRDGAISQQPLEVALIDGRQVADGHGGDRHEGQDGFPGFP